MLDEDRRRNVIWKAVFHSEVVDLLKVLHEWFLEGKSMHGFLLGQHGYVGHYMACSMANLMSCCSGLTFVDSLAVFVMQASECLRILFICLISIRRSLWLSEVCMWEKKGRGTRERGKEK